MQVTASIVVDGSPDDVFRFVSDVTNMPRWVKGVSSARLAGDPMGRGARFLVNYTAARKVNEIEFEVATYERPVAFGTVTTKGPFSFEGRLTFQQAENGTLVTNAIEAGPDSVATQVAVLLFGRFLRSSWQRRLVRELEGLRAAVADSRDSIR
jgi:ribosome-associated toxin RatA of RatAB toxin-antitoxin module